MDHSPQSQMDSATASLARSLGITKDELIGQIVSECLRDLEDRTGSRPPYIRLGAEAARPRHLSLVDVEGSTAHLEGSKG
ncbi:hypothetical protein [Euzebya tangerina]|uniref:hypothetical protein n=1 Tax=Euzebya tangerina TaxID=591198 RepID=UPI0013C32F92|nr:hypothetical protein [Euzebya tangerina]